MKNTKDNQRETIITEITAWMFVIGIIYIFAKVII